MNFNYKQMFTKLSTSIEMRVFMFTHLLFGNYFKAFSSKIASIILRLYCCLITISVLAVGSVNIYYQPLLCSSWTNICEVTISFIMSQITSQKYLITFANTLNTLDCLIGFKAKSNLLHKTFLFAIIIKFVASIRSSIMLLPTKSIVIHLCIAVLWYTTLVRYGKSGVVISLMHHRLNLLRKHIEKNDIPVNIIGSEGINELIHVVRKSLIYYDNMLDAFDAIDHFMQFEVVLICVLYLPKSVLLLHMWITTYLGENFDELFFSHFFTQLCLEVTVAFSSCIMMCCCNREVDQIKKTLVLQIINCSDVSLQEELENLLQHVTRRPFRFTLLRAVRVDLYLPINIISTAITYVIILLQFTHFSHFH